MNVRKVNYKQKDAPYEFTRSLKQTGFSILNHHPIDKSLIDKLNRLSTDKLYYDTTLVKAVTIMPTLFTLQTFKYRDLNEGIYIVRVRWLYLNGGSRNFL